jgi:hypothetical protein
MISDSAKLSYFKKIQDLSKTESGATSNMTMQSSDANHRKKKWKIEGCWKSHRDTLMVLLNKVSETNKQSVDLSFFLNVV